MKPEILNVLIKSGLILPRQSDFERVKSLIKSAEINANVARKISLDEDSATLIFREIYESIRQLGEAKWRLAGYEPQNHDISLEILKEISMANKSPLNHLERFKKIRHDANYRGFRVLVSQAKEIVDFWASCSKDIIKDVTNNPRYTD